jgi:hypothetical protein
MQDTSESPVRAALRLGPIQIVVITIVALIAVAGRSSRSSSRRR